MKKHFEGGTRVFANLKDPLLAKKCITIYSMFQISKSHISEKLFVHAICSLKPIDDNRFKSDKSVKVMHDDWCWNISIHINMSAYT